MLKVKNYQLVDVLEFLERAELKPRASRVRTKLNRLIYAKIEDLQADEMALLERYGKRGGDGKLIESGGTYSLEEATAAEYHAEKRALLEESAAINVAELKDRIDVLTDELLGSDMRLAGKDAEAFALLLDALEAEAKHEA